MVMKNEGRERNSKKSKEVKIIKCKNCKEEYEYNDIIEDTYKVGNKTFVLCYECGEQIKLK